MSQKQFLLTLLLAIISAFLGGTLGVWFLMPPSVLAQDEEVIEAQEFRVLDDDSRIRVSIDSDGITLLKDGRIDMIIQSDGITFSDEQGAPRTFWSSSSDYSMLGFAGDNGQLQMGMSPEGPEIIMRDSNEEEGLSLRLLRNKPTLTLSDSGDTRAIIGTTELKNNRTGSTEIRAPSSLVLFDEDGDVVWSAP